MTHERKQSNTDAFLITWICLTGIMKVFSSCCHLQTVYLRRCINVTDDAIGVLTQHCSHLEHLNLCGCINITDASLDLVALNCRFLQSLNISKTKVIWLIQLLHDEYCGNLVLVWNFKLVLLIFVFLCLNFVIVDPEQEKQ